MDPITLAAILTLSSTLVQAGIKLFELLNQAEGLTDEQKQTIRDEAARLTAATALLSVIPAPPE